MKELTPDRLRELLLSGNDDVRARFVETFGPGLTNFSILMSNAAQQLISMSERVRQDLRSAYTYEFLYGAFNNLFSAFHLLFSGYWVPMGNQRRQFGESIAMALLCSHREIDVFDRLRNEELRFPTQKAIGMVNKRQHRKLLNIDADGWKRFDEITKTYDKVSHPTLLTIASTRIFSTGGRQLGGEFDAHKFATYNRDVSLSLSGAMLLRVTTIAAERNLTESAVAD